MALTKKQKTKIDVFVQDYYKYDLRKDDKYTIERYVDYDEEFPESSIKKILESDNPWETFDEIVSDWDIQCDDWYYQDEFKRKFEEFCNKQKYDEDEAKDYLFENFRWCYPDSFLNPTFNAVITLNTGDMNYDYTLHNILNYASDYGYESGPRGELDKKAGMFWLAKQQGKSTLLQKTILKYINKKDFTKDDIENKFVKSCIQELENATTHMTAMTFLVQLDLETAMKIAVTQTQLEEEKKFDVFHPLETKGSPFGSITLSKNCMCGLFDAWNGGGSVLEVELEKDVKIPIHLIRHVSTDDFIQKVYGLTQECWSGEVNKIDLKEIA